MGVMPLGWTLSNSLFTVDAFFGGRNKFRRQQYRMDVTYAHITYKGPFVQKIDVDAVCIVFRCHICQRRQRISCLDGKDAG